MGARLFNKECQWCSIWSVDDYEDDDQEVVANGGGENGACRQCGLRMLEIKLPGTDGEKTWYSKCMWCDEVRMEPTQIVEGSDDESSVNTFGHGEHGYVRKCRRRGSLGNEGHQVRAEEERRNQRVTTEEERCGMWWRCPIRKCKIDNNLVFIFDEEKERLVYRHLINHRKLGDAVIYHEDELGGMVYVNGAPRVKIVERNNCTGEGEKEMYVAERLYRDGIIPLEHVQMVEDLILISRGVEEEMKEDDMEYSVRTAKERYETMMMEANEQ